MSNTHQKTSVDYSKFVGIPYEEKNCWELCRDFYREILGVELKTYFEGPVPTKEITKSLIYTNLGDFIRVADGEKLLVGDLVLMKIFGIEAHIGVYLGQGNVLHTSKVVGSNVDRVGRLGKLITGFFRMRAGI